MFIKYLTTVFDNIGVSILLVSVESDGRFKALAANKNFGQSSGFPVDIVGKYMDDIVAPETYAAISARYASVAHCKEVLQYSDWLSVPNGKRAYEVKLIPILSTVGECVQIIMISRDVTYQYETHRVLSAGSALAAYLAPRVSELCLVIDNNLIIIHAPLLPSLFDDWHTDVSLKILLSSKDSDYLAKQAAVAKKHGPQTGSYTVSKQVYAYTIAYDVSHDCFVISMAEDLSPVSKEEVKNKK
jgi:hypothetical protein